MNQTVVSDAALVKNLQDELTGSSTDDLRRSDVESERPTSFMFVQAKSAWRRQNVAKQARIERDMKPKSMPGSSRRPARQVSEPAKNSSSNYTLPLHTADSRRQSDEVFREQEGKVNHTVTNDTQNVVSHDLSSRS